MVSRRFHLVTLCFWPGLPQIWAGQVITGLATASLFALLFNACIVFQWIYTDWADASQRQMLWLITILTHLSMLAWTVVWAWKFHPEKFRQEIDRLFRESNDNYLKGRWALARDQLENLIAIDPQDTEALLRLTRVLYRTGEKSLAFRALSQCKDTPGAARWQWEIEQMASQMAESA